MSLFTAALFGGLNRGMEILALVISLNQGALDVKSPLLSYCYFYLKAFITQMLCYQKILIIEYN